MSETLHLSAFETPSNITALESISQTMTEAYRATGGRTIAIWVPNYEWIQRRLGLWLVVPPFTLWGVPVRRMPGSVDEAVRRHTLNDRYWLELPEDFWWDGFLPDSGGAS